MRLLRYLRELDRKVTAVVSDALMNMLRSARDAHEPFRIDYDPYALCFRCSNGWTGKAVPWPCDHYMRLDERLRELQRAPDA